MISSLASVVLTQFVILTAVHCCFHFTKIQDLFGKKKLFAVACVVILGLQLGFAALQTKEVGDVMLFAGAGWHVRHQIDFYFIDSQHTQYPFFPFLIFIHAGLNALQELLPVFTFSWYLKIVLSGCLIGIGWVLLEESPKNKRGRIQVLQFFSHPVTTLVIFFHGQVDVFLLLFVILAFWLQKQQKQLMHQIGSIALFAASIAAKTWSVLLLPFFWLKLPRFWQLLSPIILVTALIGNVFVYTRLVEGSSVRTVLPAIGAAGGPIGEWGLSLLWANPAFWGSFGLYLVLGVVALLSLWLYIKKVEQWDALLIILFAIQLVLPRWGIQYLFWSLPFWFLSKQLSNTQRSVLTIAASGFAVLNYLNIAQQVEQQQVIFNENLVRSVGIACWLTICFVTLHLLRKVVYRPN